MSLSAPFPNAATENMCTAARHFILGRDSGVFKWGEMKEFLDNCGENNTCARINEMAAKQPLGHITKWDVAECIYVLMETQRIKEWQKTEGDPRAPHSGKPVSLQPQEGNVF